MTFNVDPDYKFHWNPLNCLGNESHSNSMHKFGSNGDRRTQ